MDYNLPDGDGASATRQIADAGRARVILLRGFSDDDAVFEAAWGGCGY